MLRIRDRDRWFIDRVLPHAEAYYRQARRWAPDADAVEEIVQEAYLRVIGTENPHGVQSPKAFTLNIVRNIAIDRLRRAQAIPFDRSMNAAEIERMDDTPDAHARMVARQELQRVEAAITALPPQCRRVVQMRRIEERSPGEIADTLGISLSTVETHLARGIARVMGALRYGRAERDELAESEQDDRQGSGGGGGVAGTARRGHG